MKENHYKQQVTDKDPPTGMSYSENVMLKLGKIIWSEY